MSTREKMSDKELALKEETTCGGKTNDGNYCLMSRGKNTDHPGEGRCWQHDLLVNGTEVSLYKIPALEERMEELILDKDIYNLDKEIVLMRSYLELYNEYLTLFKAFNSLQLIEAGVNFSPTDLNTALNTTVNTIAKLVKTKSEMEIARKYVIDIKTVKLMLLKVADIIDRNIDDPMLKNKIGNQLGQILLS